MRLCLSSVFPIARTKAHGPVVVTLLSALLFLPLGPARADVVGRLRFAVKNAADEKPLAGALIVLKDSANVRPDVTLTTGADGTVLSGPLENRAFAATTTANAFQTDARSVTVAADATTDVEVLLEPTTEKVIRITGNRTLVNSNTASGTRRDNAFVKRFPTTAGNLQSLSKAIRTNPGFVEDSVNQVHPRGEHSQTSIYINGFLLPGALQGRAGQFLAPDAIQTYDVQTGGFAPEYGGELAAILNLTLRSGTIAPFVETELQGGDFSTFQGTLTVGGQGGANFGPPTATGQTAKRFGYLFNVTQRNTNNGIEPPQPDRQNTHNYQTSTTVFGNLEYRLQGQDTLSLFVNTAPARSDIANRTGLPGRYRGLGQGFGYAGDQDAGSTTTDANGNVIPLVSQNDARQDIYQEDANTFVTLQYRRQFSPSTNGQFSVGYSDSRLDIKNHNPSVDINVLPQDSSIEYNPNILRRYNQTQVQGNVTIARTAAHTLKFGGLYSDQHGEESYNLIPASRLALNALVGIGQGVAPNVLTGEDGTPLLDADGNVSLAPGATIPTLKVDRNGYYAALYAQDTFRVTPKFSVNYGARFDAYNQKQNLGQDNINITYLSPRVNAAYSFTPRTVVRANYDKLFSQPPLAQGAILGRAIRPQTVDMYETSIEQQFGGNQRVKLAGYQKYFRDQIDTGILIEGTQIGAYTSLNLGRAAVKGVELSYDIVPRNNVGLGAYTTWANATAKPHGIDNLGEPINDLYNDHDQLNTVTAGLDYTLKSGASAGLNFYYGSGLASSVVGDDNDRQQRTEFDLRVSSGQRLTKSGLGLNLLVENLFDHRSVINYRSAFSGTRFQQGRRVLLSLSGRF